MTSTPLTVPTVDHTLGWEAGEVRFIPERQTWLIRAMPPLRSYAVSRGLILPERLAVRVGRPQLVEGVPARGEYWPSSLVPEAIPTIVVSDLLRDPIEVLGVVLHELIHAADDAASGHGQWFVSWSGHLGLVGSPATAVGPGLKWRLRCLTWMLGPYPESQFGVRVTSSGSTLA